MFTINRNAHLEEIVQHLADAEPVPEAAEQQGATDPVGDDPAGIDIGENDGTFGVPCDGGDEPVEFARCGEDILATEGFDGALADGFAHAHAFHEVEIAVAAGDSLDDEHADVVTATPC